MRGDLAFALLMEAFVRSFADGDTAVAAIVAADAAAVGGRAPATFDDPPPNEQLLALVELATALAPPDDPEVAAHVTAAAAWNVRPRPLEPDPALADRALAQARDLDDPVLISGALDLVAAAASAEGRFKDASRLTAERLGLVHRMRRHDPRAGGEVVDIFHMGMEAAMAAGELPAALAAARRAHEDSLEQGFGHFAATHLVVPLALRGAFDEAAMYAEVMREGWERTGRPAAGWMAPSFLAAALVHGLRGDADTYRDWWSVAEVVRVNARENGFSDFVEARIALHQGDIDAAVAMITTSSDITCAQYTAYAEAMAVEIAIVAGLPDAEGRLERAAPLGIENDFVAACLLRASGRLHDDEATLTRAVASWEQLGARFERACTLLLVPSRRDEGRRELAALRCAAPGEPTARH